MAKDYSAMKVVELKEVAKRMKIKGYSRMNKAQLIKALEGVQEVMSEVNGFVPKYNSNVVMDKMKNFKSPATPKQMNYIRTLERNYDFKVDTTKCSTKIGASQYITELTAMIESGELKKRPAEEVNMLIKSDNVPKQVRLASKAQLDYITKLEQETGSVVKDVIDSSEKANKVINELLAIKRARKFEAKEVAKEVACDKVDDNVDQRFIDLGKKVKASKDWKNAVISFFKRFV